MTEIESAWDRYPGYVVALRPWTGKARVRHGQRVLAESDAAVIVAESDHQDRLYLPAGDVDWSHLRESAHRTTCPFKGEAEYWSVVDDAGEMVEADCLWAYRRPFPEVAGLDGLVAFYDDRVEVELIEPWPGDGDAVDEVVHRFPVWGSAALLRDLIDVGPAGEGRFTSPPNPDPPFGTFLDIAPEKRPRQVIEGGHLLGQAIVGASRTVTDQRVVTASMTFTRAALFDAPLTVDVDVVRRGRTYSTVETRTRQHDKVCAVGLVLLDAGADDAYRNAAAMPDVPAPEECPPRDFGVTGREVRVVGGAYNQDPDETGPAELHVWTRFREPTGDPALDAALLAQSCTHYTIAASMRPHRGITEALAHVSLSTGPMAAQIAFHDEADLTQWHLYENPAIYSGRGHVQGQGRVFARDGRLVASYSIHAMVRPMITDPSRVGGYATAM